MKSTITIMAAMAVGMAASAQTLAVSGSGITYYFPASEQEMTFAGGNTVTIDGKSLLLDDFASMQVVADCPVEQNQVVITYAGASATAQIHGSVAQYVDVAISGANVQVTQSDRVSESTCGEITYVLTGESSNGSFTLEGSYKASIDLNGVSLINPAGTAIDIQNGKRIELSAKSGTVNVLEDGSGSQKAALYCKGHLELKGKGSLTVKGNQSHAIAAKEYITVKNLTLTVTGAVKDGINCNQYFSMESGTVTISNTGDDGIQVAYKDDADREAEDTGSATIAGGKLDIAIAKGEAAKGIKADGNVEITGGEIKIETGCNGMWDAAKAKTKASSCIGADGNITIADGTLDLKATGSGGKGISCDGIFTCSGGTIDIVTSGGMLVYTNGSLNHNYTSSADRINSDNKSSAKGVKADSGLVISGGKITVYTSTNNAEGLESKSTMTISGGEVFVKGYDDGINSTSDLTISGGKVTVMSIVGDAIDSNANMYISGGDIIALGSGGAEQGLDAADESRCAVYITGGNVLSFGGRNAPVSKVTDSQALVTVSGAIAASTTVSVATDAETLASFEIPVEYNSSASGPNRGPGNGPGGGGWNPGGGSGSGRLLISCPALESGTKYNVKNGDTTTSATATYTSTTN